ncbi:hypothetical protein DESUT3_28580 [Desulfuromonas versatilis]|uniref:N-acetyltransferase domain-containing protein n=1 Tax=Desulfuromonas versatilis TaxID=2802975 RepID=A0ABM8HYA1_9BACT|nr:GNAT family N-acetyltransferase [Desulfuromonas versatilis]BCR05789.1 hypothetical protein DESUT3_28580 [Desulfuromonas versatilis]
MNLEVEVRFAQVRDVGAVCSLALRSFGAELTDRLIYGSGGFPFYMREQLEVPGGFSDTRYLVAASGGEMAGFAEILCRPPQLFLNYICADKQKNIKGLGSLLLYRSLQTLGAGNCRSLLLDVFDSNVKAVSWYRALGFEETGRHTWWAISLPECPPDVSGYLCQLPQAMACQRRFGFSRFQVRTAGQVYEVGMLGDRWFRITSPEILEDGDALGLLRRLDPGRRLLAILPEKTPPAGWLDKARTLDTSLRMEAGISPLMQALENKL